MAPTLRQRLAAGNPVGVVWMMLGCPAIAEVAATLTPDAVVFDAQHGLWDRSALEAGIGALRGATPSLVRVAENSAAAIGPALDAGADGVIVPMIETAEQAAAAVAFARFPPHGARSAGGVRPLARGFAAYHAAASANTVAAVMIETVAGVANADAIARTPGLDLVLLGPGDLALSLGCAGLPDARHDQACADVLAACRRNRVACGTFASGQDTDAFYQLVVLANDLDVVATGFGAGLRGFSQRISKPPLMSNVAPVTKPASSDAR